MNQSIEPSDRLRAERERLKLTRPEAAAKCGVSPAMWGRYERGLAKPGSDVVAAMGRIGFDVVYLLQGTPSSFEASAGRLARASKIVTPMGLPREQAAKLIEQVYNALSGDEIDPRERQLVESFRSANEEAKQAIEATATALAKAISAQPSVKTKRRR